MRNYAYLLIILLCSCNKPLKVTVISSISSSPATIVFDDKDTLLARGPIDTIFLSSNKLHQFTVNGSPKQSFFLRDKGGLLNLAKKEFMVLENTYVSEGENENASWFMTEYNLESYVLIDSFIVCGAGSKMPDQAQLKVIVDSIRVRKNGNYKPAERFPEEVDEYDKSEEVNVFKKIGNQDLFVKQFWNYNFGDSIPNEISVRLNESQAQYKNRVKKTLIVFADIFLSFAKMSKDKYHVIDVRELLKGKIDGK